MIQTMAKMKAPSIKEPILYLKDHQKPWARLKVPLASAVQVKYHVQTATMTTYEKIA